MRERNSIISVDKAERSAVLITYFAAKRSAQPLHRVYRETHQGAIAHGTSINRAGTANDVIHMHHVWRETSNPRAVPVASITMLAGGILASPPLF